MKVLFIKDLLPTAMAGEVLDVRNGFARNRLFPYAFALPATEGNLTRAAELQAEAKKRRAKMASDWAGLAQKIKAEQFVITARSTPKGRLYGSVTQAMIASQIETLMEIKLPKNAVRTQPLRFAGKHTVNLLLHPGVETSLDITVEADISTATTVQPEGTAADNQESSTATTEQPEGTAADNQESSTATTGQPEGTAADNQESSTATTGQPEGTAANNQESSTATTGQPEGTAANNQESSTASGETDQTDSTD